MMSPAICTAVNSTCTMKPSPAPIATSVSAETMRNPGVIAGRSAVTLCSSATDRASASAPFTGAGMPRELKGGASITKPAARQVASSSPARVTAGTERSTRLRPAEQRRQHVEQGVGEADQLGQHPVARHEQRDRDGDHLGDERQRLLLDLRGRLEQRDHEPDQQRRQQDRCGDLGGEQHRLQREVGDLGVSHRRYPAPYEWTSAVVISAHPSTTTNSSSLNGSDTIAGGTIIMPIAMSAALTSMSSTRNGMNTTSPMMNALFSSERTKAGMSVVMLTSLLSLGASSPERLIISLSSSSRVFSRRKPLSGTTPAS